MYISALPAVQVAGVAQDVEATIGAVSYSSVVHCREWAHCTARLGSSPVAHLRKQGVRGEVARDV
jgi:hypothetical protein